MAAAAATVATFFVAFFSHVEGVNGCVSTSQRFDGGDSFTCVLTNATSNNGTRFFIYTFLDTNLFVLSCLRD